MTRQSVFSVNRYPMNLSYINSRASINNIYIKELLTRLVKLNRTLKIHNGDEPIHILQIRSQQYLMLPINTCKFTMFDYFKDVIVEAVEYLKNNCSHYSGKDQPFKVDIDPPSLTPRDTELLYCHVARLWFTSKRANSI